MKPQKKQFGNKNRPDSKKGPAQPKTSSRSNSSSRPSASNTSKSYGSKSSRSTNSSREAQASKPSTPKDSNSSRLNKYIANSGVCSRREADIYIQAGSVTVNGKAITEMGYQVKKGDEVRFDGVIVNPVKKEYILLNKPKDFDTVTRDGQGRRSALQLVSNASKSNLSPVGRLNKSSSGLMLFTNDGELIKTLSAPKNGFQKLYHVTLNKPLAQEDLDAVKEGIPLDGKIMRVQDISFIENAPRKEVGIETRSSKSNLVRRIFEKLEYEVVTLDRVIYAGLTKKDLPRGHWRPLTQQEIINLKMIK